MRRNLTAVYIHLVWGTWDRLPLLTDELLPAVYRAIGAKATELGHQWWRSAARRTMSTCSCGCR